MARKPIDPSAPRFPVPTLHGEVSAPSPTSVPAPSRARTLSGEQKYDLLNRGANILEAGMVVAKTMADTDRIRAEGEVTVNTIRAQAEALKAEGEKTAGEIAARGKASLDRSQGLAQLVSVTLEKSTPESAAKNMEMALGAWTKREEVDAENKE